MEYKNRHNAKNRAVAEVDYYTCDLENVDSNKENYTHLNCNYYNELEFDFVKKTVKVLNFNKLLIDDEYDKLEINKPAYINYKPDDFINYYEFYKSKPPIKSTGGKRKSRRKLRKNKRKTRRN